MRVRVAAILAAGATVREAARRFGISVASAVRIGQPARSGQGLAARRIGGDRQPILLNASEAIIRRLVSKADRTGRALAADLKADGTAVSHDTVRRFLRRQGLTFKTYGPPRHANRLIPKLWLPEKDDARFKTFLLDGRPASCCVSAWKKDPCWGVDRHGKRTPLEG